MEILSLNMLTAYLTNLYQTSLHKFWVFWFILKFCWALIKRAIVHDFSKYSKEEEPYFRRQLHLLKNTPFGTPEYAELLKSIQPALEHHYENNSHHPQFYRNGIEGMSLLDEIEMLADWKAAGLRHTGGCIYKSIKLNADRFHYNPYKISSYERAVDEAL